MDNKEYNKQWRLKHSEHLKEYRKERYLKNKINILKKRKIYYQKHRTEILKYAKKRAIKKGIFKGTYGFGKKLSIEHKNNISLGERGKIVPVDVRKKISFAQRGNKSHRWQGGITPILETERRRIEFRLWREAVFTRDNWTCQECKIRGGKLRAHHIKSFAKFPELRFALDNGITLCERCHFKTDNYGGKSRNVNYFLGRAR